MSNGELQELLDFAVAVAREAGEITLRYFRREFETRQPTINLLNTSSRRSRKPSHSTC